jgi:DUF4097 and DUF4098 domain-containing protein YvlB
MAKIDLEFELAKQQEASLVAARRAEQERLYEKRRQESRRRRAAEEESAWRCQRQREINAERAARRRPWPVGRPNPLTTTTITVHTSLPEVQFATRKRKRNVVEEEEWESPEITPSVVNKGFAVAFAVFGVCLWAAKLLK